MAFLASGRTKERAGTQHLTSCLSTNHRTAAEGKSMSIFRRTTVQRDSRPLRGRPGGSAAVSSFCPLTARAQRRRERERREEEQQRRRREGREEEQQSWRRREGELQRRRRRERMEEDRREGHLLRPRQLSLQVRRTNKVAMVTGLSEQRRSGVRSVPTLKPTTGGGSRRSPRPCTRPSNTCKPRPQESNNKHLSRHTKHQLPLQHPTVSNHFSNPKTFGSLQNSGRHSSRTPIALTNGSVTLGENPAILRSSRRRRGLPPDTSPAPQNRAPLDNSSSKKCRTVQCSDGDVPSERDCHIGAMPQRDCDPDVREEYVSHITGSHDGELGQCVSEGDTRPESCISEDLQDKVSVRELSLKPSHEGVTNAITDSDPVTEVICRHVREKRLPRNQPASPAIPKMITRTTDSRTASRAATARTTATKAAINSVKSTHTHTHSAKHTAKGTNKGTSKDVTKCTSPASSYSIHSSKGAAKDTSKGTAEDSNKDSAPVSSYSSTSKGSTKGLTKSTTSAIKTRTSPRILLKR